MSLTLDDLRTPGVGLQIGVEPGRIDLLTSISGVEVHEAWPGRVEASFGDDVRCCVIGVEHLLRNKRAAGRFRTWLTSRHWSDCSTSNGDHAWLAAASR
jgi:hypothetical protein